MELRENIEHNVIIHHSQLFNWDCGVSCIAMLLDKDQREKLFSNLEEICKEEGFGKFTWTIDLCYLLKRFGIKHCMYTTFLGVNEAYWKQSYYNNNNIDFHTDRIQRRFDDAEAQGIAITKRSISTPEIIEHLINCGPVIVLVDAGLLVCDLCKHNKLRYEFRRCFGGGYSGHYIVVSGYNRKTNKLLYHDPALSARICAVNQSRFNEARLAQGTDEDVVLIFNKLRSFLYKES